MFVLLETKKKVIKHQPDIYIQVQMRRDHVVWYSRSYQIEQHHKLNAQTCSTKKMLFVRGKSPRRQRLNAVI